MKTQPDKLDSELRNDVLTEFRQVLKLAPADYTENCTNVVMSMLTTEIHKAEMALLERLQSKSIRHIENVDDDEWEYEAIPLSAIEDEKYRIREEQL